MYEQTIEICKRMDGWLPEYNTGLPVSDQEVTQAEMDLGFSLCIEHEAYLKELGWLDITGIGYLGIMAGKGRKNAASDFVTATIELSKSISLPSRYTVLQNESYEWYVLVDHNCSVVKFYDPFSKEFISSNKNMVDYFNESALGML